MSEIELLRRHDLVAHLKESLRIEGIIREPSNAELCAAERFLNEDLSIHSVLALQKWLAPGKPLRDQAGMDVRVGRHIPPPGGLDVLRELDALIIRIRADESFTPWQAHVRFEDIHPFMDGNGRTGRLIWVWHMIEQGKDPWGLSFLHTFYYQTLAANEGVKKCSES